MMDVGVAVPAAARTPDADAEAAGNLAEPRMPVACAAVPAAARTPDTDAEAAGNLSGVPRMPVACAAVPSAARTPAACRTRWAYSPDTDAHPLAQVLIREARIHTAQGRSNNKGPDGANPRSLRKLRRRRIKTKPPTLP